MRRQRKHHAFGRSKSSSDMIRWRCWKWTEKRKRLSRLKTDMDTKCSDYSERQSARKGIHTLISIRWFAPWCSTILFCPFKSLPNLFKTIIRLALQCQNTLILVSSSSIFLFFSVSSSIFSKTFSLKHFFKSVGSEHGNSIQSEHGSSIQKTKVNYNRNRNQTEL